jgi:stearoyl-CoA desaturase (delta-9 desaturase)
VNSTSTPGSSAATALADDAGGGHLPTLAGSCSTPSGAVIRRATIPFFIVHFIPLLAIFTGITQRALVLGAVLYLTRLFFITAGYHRYFAHRAFRLGRVTQAVFAFGAGTAAQKGPLWWAANHRAHHRYTDTERDPHSPQRGFWWSHVGWILSDRFAATDFDAIEDFAKYPELRWLNKHDWVAPWALGVASYFIAGWSGLVVGFFASTIVLWHATFSINSFAHLSGSRRFATGDSSRNNPLLALATFGEGWHNNHHHYPRSARQGIRWWEIDVTYRVLQALRPLRIVHDLREPPRAAIEARRVKKGICDIGMMRYHLSRAARAARRTPNADHLIHVIENTAQQLSSLAREQISDRGRSLDASTSA